MIKKSILAVGSIGIDWLELPNKISGKTIGGSLTYFTRTAGLNSKVNIVGIIGDDYPTEGKKLFDEFGNNLDDLQIVKGKNFSWGGKYHENWEDRTTLFTELGVFQNFHPKLSEKNKKSDFIYLGNIHPNLQLEVLEQIKSKNNVTACDTMNLWIETTQYELIEVIKQVDILFINESEAIQLSNSKNLESCGEKILKMGPKILIIKKGSSGCKLFSKDLNIEVGVYPIKKIIDPTGAGDSFAGGVMTAIANGFHLSEALLWGTACASFCVEGFGLEGFKQMTQNSLKERIEYLKNNII